MRAPEAPSPTPVANLPPSPVYPVKRSKPPAPTRLTSDRGNGPVPSDCHFPACIRTVCFFSVRALFLAPVRNYFLRLSAPPSVRSFGSSADCYPAVDRPRSRGIVPSLDSICFFPLAVSPRLSRWPDKKRRARFYVI